jgi:DNA-binding transcriptional MerR regulator
MSELIRLAAASQPKNRNSVLDPYLHEIRELQEQGYSLEQIRGFLAQMNITVSRQTIHDFIKRRETVKQKPKAPEQAPRTQAKPEKSLELPGFKHNPVPNKEELY